MSEKVNVTPSVSRKEKALAKKNARLAKQIAKKKTKIRETTGDRVLMAFTTCFLVFILVLVAYPVIYVISCSFSSDKSLSLGDILLLPKEPSLVSYKRVLQDNQVWMGYKNTIFYTVFGVTITMVLQALAAYPLSKRNYQGRNFLMAVFFVTTMVGAGLIPTFLVRKSMGMINNVWAVLLAGAMSVHNMIILRTSFRSSIPGELYDAAAIDGANDFQTLIKIALPLCKATLSVLTLYSAVGCWNEYFTSMIYNGNRPDLMPLNYVLRPYMKANYVAQESAVTSADMLQQANSGAEGMTFALIVISTVPVLVMYFVVQKYFEKGVMVGSVKG